MDVIKADSLGFCMGVRRAMQTVYNIIDLYPDQPVYTFGPLIHNRLVLEDLERRGVRVIEDPLESEGGIVIIRAHGIKLMIKKQLESTAYKVIDASCPRVLNSHKKVFDASARGLHIIIAGDKNHGEVQGIAGYAGSYSILETAEQAKIFEITGKALLISQTTFGKSEYKKICDILAHKYPDIEIAYSICPATEKRQASLKKLASLVDAVVVIGGKTSANTVRLYQSALKYGKKAWHIENALELPEEIKDFKVIGITAGASTPDWIIKEVEHILKSY